MTIFIISDLHFDDDNIRTEFDRPFKNVANMNEFIIRRWNQVVSETDQVLFVGDVVGTDGVESTEDVRNQIQFRFEQLSGEIALIPGNHDKIGHPNTATFRVAEAPQFSIDGLEFQCQHRPPSSRQERWIIHGHEHTNHNDEYPFINPQKQTINVSAELLHYTPIPLETLISLIRTETRYAFCPPSFLGC